MLFRASHTFVDKETGQTVQAGETFEASQERADEVEGTLQALGKDGGKYASYASFHLEPATKQELSDYAKDKGIDIEKNATKAEIIEAIEASS